MLSIQEITPTLQDMSLEEIQRHKNDRDGQIEAIQAEKKILHRVFLHKSMQEQQQAAGMSPEELNQTMLHDASTMDALVAKFGLATIIAKVKELGGKF